MPMGSQDLFAPAGNHGPIENHAYQLPQWRQGFETPKSQWQREIRTAISPSNKVRGPDCSPWFLKTPQGYVPQPSPSSQTPLISGCGDYRSPINENSGDPKTPESHRLKRKGSDLTPSSQAGVLGSRDSMGTSNELYKLSLGSPPSFNLNTSPEQMSRSGGKSQRTEQYTHQNSSCNDSRPRYYHANQSHATESTSAQDSNGSPSRDSRPTIRKLAPYTKRPPHSLAPEMILCQAIVKPLTKQEMGIAWRKSSSGISTQQKSHDGWIYIYQLPNEVNTLKIGITQASIEGRLDSWTEQCGHKPQIAYPTTASERESVPNIYRLEALVQAELAANRLEEVECACGTTHIEWFQEALAHARKVVVKWSTWMRTNPYKEVEPGHWHLSPQYISELAELSRPSRRVLVEGSASNPFQV